MKKRAYLFLAFACVAVLALISPSKAVETAIEMGQRLTKR